VAALTVLAFLPTFTNGWVDFDDTAFILKNAHLSSLSPGNLGWMLSSFYGGHYHPLTWLSLALNMIVFGMGPLSFHLTDLALHVSNAVLFFLIARRLLDGDNAAAAAAALFFSIHPLRVESVAWAIERRDVLSGLFYLSTILLHLKAIDDPGKSWRRFSWLTYAASLLSKGIGITLPLALTLLDLYPLKRRGAWREKIPYWLMAAGAAGAAFYAEASNGAALGLGSYPLGQRIGVAVYGLAFYLRKTILPIQLLPLYELPQQFNPLSSPFLLSAAWLLAVVLVLYLMGRRWPTAVTAIAACAAFYVITIVPVLGLVRFGPQLAADRYSYLACLGWAVLFGAGFKAARSRQAAPVIVSVVLAACGIMTFLQTSRWHDAVSLWSYALDVDPDIAMGQQHLGYALAGQGQYTQAIPHYQKALALKPDYWLAYDNIGWSWAATGRLDAACAAYRKALELKPDYWEAHSNLGLALGRLNRLGEAETQFKEAIKLAPEEPGLHSNLGLVYFTQGRHEQAAQEFQTALGLDPSQPQARMMLQRLAGRTPVRSMR
jgi:tetratricopeptide (TPR) repeat protein